MPKMVSSMVAGSFSPWPEVTRCLKIMELPRSSRPPAAGNRRTGHQRLVEPQFLFFLLDHLVRCVAAQHGRNRVAGHDTDHDENDAQEDEQHGNGQKGPGDDVSKRFFIDGILQPMAAGCLCRAGNRV
jgi:hypothetical protein